ncbi:aspartokinase 2, chloroplastic-like protein isoform X1, partial [Tanacetum coccineum]
MSTNINLYGANITYHRSLYSHQQLSFASSVASFRGTCIVIQGRVSCRRNGFKVVCNAQNVAVRSENENLALEGLSKELSCVMKFGGSSVASAERMREVAALILRFPEECPVIVLSAMGKTTNKILLVCMSNIIVTPIHFKAGEKATCGESVVAEINELRELHYRTVDELGLDRSIITYHLEKLGRLVEVIAELKEFTPRTRDYLVSFGERMSTRIFAAYLNKLGVKSRQYDAFEIGFITTDDFTNADILEETYPAVAERLNGDWIKDPAIPIVTGFLGKGRKTGDVTTLGRGGSDLTATTIGKALGLREIQ